MSTFLFSDIVFGPVNSRRLGVSLGINILPTSKKFCNFNCVYCECGLNDSLNGSTLPTREEVKNNLIAYFEGSPEKPDAITFAGNGEPTIHPDFSGIIDDTIKCRDIYAPDAEIVVLSNATMIHKKSVVDALCRVDQNILKIDSAYDETVEIINQPAAKKTKAELIRNMQQFDGKLIVQSLFLRGEVEGKAFDNTTDDEIRELIAVYKEVNPLYVMVYGISRDTPYNTLEKISKEKLEQVSRKIEEAGIKTVVSY